MYSKHKNCNDVYKILNNFKTKSKQAEKKTTNSPNLEPENSAKVAKNSRIGKQFWPVKV